MKLHKIFHTQKLPITLEEAWQYFTNPDNLEVLTLKDMGLINDKDMPSSLVYPDNSLYQGKLITHSVKVLPFYRMNWVSEITAFETNKYFVDQQRFGPYQFWHHTHIFREIDKGVEVVDFIRYVLPLGVLGRLAHPLLVKPKLDQVFTFRQNTLEEIFGKYKKIE